ncbi:peptidase domain-containing ABC transporter [Xenorhabdus sp. Reich]|uniref:Peptidase domain-containing ABC transporter n=1 Tax=Xenorhabdus littoralis TaxID=2582835 RepID=A0ABU4SL76_9GAMM|nr:peptidase domain-containing ABC transporter [Xenorhabdus sp. Reich]MDX7999404.1 peptidase domain-containing ABC transporter [Xenorhabdus sp. Reich]
MNNKTLKSFLSKLDIGFCHRVPLIHQTESSECGMASLAMVAGYYGKNIDLITLRQRFNLSARGTTLASVKEMAAELDMTSRALSLDLDEINALKTPCILHWNFNHFVVLISVRKDRFILHDPAQGRIVVGLAEMSRSFTGIALEIFPNSKFTAETKKSRLQLKTLFQSIHGIKGTLTKIFFLSLIIEFINLIMPIGTQLIMDHAIPAGDKGFIMAICAGVMLFILLRTLLSIISSWSSLVMATLINVQWQSGLFKHLLELPLNYFERRKLGDIQSRFASLNTLQSTFTSSIVGVIMDSIMVIGLFTMLILYGGYLTWIVLGFTTLYVLIRLFTYQSYRQLSEESLIRDARVSSYFMETLYGIATVKIQGMGERRQNHWINMKIDSINTGIKVTKMNLFFGGVNTFIAACDQIVILWLGGSLVIENQMTIGMFVAFSSYRGQFSDRVASLTNFFLHLRMISLHNERVADIALNEQESRKPDNNYQAVTHPISLETKNLNFRYDSQSQNIFSNLNMAIAPGESVAIIGPSGAGKTTLMKVLCGLFEPSSGKIIVNGNDIQQLGINNYRKIIGCVMQDDKLFSGSIRENICGFSETIDETWMIDCSKASYIHDTIMALPMGYETLIGELGEGLSGGQKQRIFIARALYRKPSILFMDEATSALDKESENYVNQAIKGLNITRVIIAHRETTIASVNRVISL